MHGPTNRHLTLSDLGVTPSLESALELMNSLMLPATLFIAMGIFLTAVALLLQMMGYAPKSPEKDPMSELFNRLSDGPGPMLPLALLCLVLAGLVLTIGAGVAKGRINAAGADVGVSAMVGGRWVALLWVAVALMVLVLVHWVWEAQRLPRSEGARVRRSGETMSLSPWTSPSTSGGY